MPRRHLALILAGCAQLLTLLSCGGGSAPTAASPPPRPSVSSFQPTSGDVSTSVTITGANFTGATSVSFNGTAAAFSVTSSTQIAATVPTGASTGKISVTTPNGTATSASNFTVTVPTPPPTISSFSPTSGLVGSSVTLTGTHLTGATSLTLNGTGATYVVNSDTQITATVPNGATSGKFTVVTPAGTATSAGSFTVTVPPPPPTISSFTPTTGQSGTHVTISGTNLTGATAFSLNGTAANFTVVSATQISAIVPNGATTGTFSVTTPGGTATSANSFTVTAPSVTLDLSIDGLYVTQATQDYPNPSIPLVESRSAWVRVFVKANETNTVAPGVRVQFVNGSTTNTLSIGASASSVPTSIDVDTNASWNASVPASWIKPGVQVHATVDLANDVPETSESNNQFSMTPDVRVLPAWRVTLIPIHTGDNRTGSVENSNRTRNDWVDFAKRMHPVPDAVDVTVGTTMNSSVNSLSSNGTGWSAVLNELRAKQVAEGGTHRYYYGVVKVAYSSGVAGLGFIGLPAAIGWDYTSGPNVLAHEEGHNFGRQHSPCGGASNPDPNYPYPGGIIGVTGWDSFASSGNLKTAGNHTDIMGYCSNQWISDYVYQSELSFRENSSPDIVSPDVVAESQEGLLVWGRIENGQMILEPAFRITTTAVAAHSGGYTWSAHDALGRVVASAEFDAPEIVDLPGAPVRIFSFVVPMDSEIIDSIQSVKVSKDGRELARKMWTPQPRTPQAAVSVERLKDGSVQFLWNASKYPVLMLRDPRTHEVRGFLRGGSAIVPGIRGELDVNFSDGIRSESIRYNSVK